MIRPELRQSLHHWRDALIGLGVLGLGFGGILQWIGYAALLLGVMLTYSGVQRGRFLSGQDQAGSGVIDLDERQLTFMGPETGVVVPLGGVYQIEIIVDAQAKQWWDFTLIDGSVARIPGRATGHEKLFDSLTGFPGAQYEKVITAASTVDKARFLIWQKSSAPPGATLH